MSHCLGGMEVHTYLLAKGLAERGHQVTMITTGHPEGKSREDKDGFVTHFISKSKPGKYSALWSVLAEEKLLELHRTDKFDLIFSESAGAFWLLKKGLNFKLSLPVVVALHGIFYNELKTRLNLGLSVKNILAVVYFLGLYLFRDLPAITKATAVIATSAEQKRLIKKFYFMPESKVFTIFNGIDTQMTPPDKELKAKLGFKPQDKLILSMARLKKEKGVHLAITALPQVLKHIPEAKLLIVGNGEYGPELKKMVTKLHLENEVRFTGTVPYAEIGKYFHLADVFVNSTIRENGYDLTIVQAMAYGKVVVVSKLKSLLGVIEPGENGFLVPRGNVRELAQTLVMVLENKTLSTAVGLRAQTKAREHFDVDTMISATEAVFNKVLQEK